MQIDSPRSPNESVRGSESSHININRITFSDRTIAVVALIFASVALGVLLMLPAYIGAEVRAGKAEAEATAKTARTDARVALDNLHTARIKLAEKGIVIDMGDH